jgi:hypothetical protein
VEEGAFANFGYTYTVLLPHHKIADGAAATDMRFRPV